MRAGRAGHPSTRWRPDLGRLAQRLAATLEEEGSPFAEVGAAALVARGLAGDDRAAWAAGLGVAEEVVDQAEGGRLPPDSLPAPLAAAVERQHRTTGIAGVQLPTVPTVVSKVERLTNLVAFLLDVARPVPLRTIVEQVPGYPAAFASARTQFIRDRDDLRDEGIVIERSGEGNDDAYRIDPATYHLPDLGLTEAETLALRLAAEAVRLEGEDPDEALLKLGTLGTDDQAFVALPSDPRLGALYEAVRRRRRITVRYDGLDRDVEPWGLLCRDGFWYLVGFDRTRHGRRTYRVDRIDGDVTVDGPDDAFRPPAGFDPRRDVPSLPFELGTGEPADASVLVDGPHARRVVAELGEDAVRERRADGSVVVAVPVRNPGGFRSWLFGMLDHARVLGPEPVVADVERWLRAMAGEG